jgi:hypothetical protein
MLSCVERLSPSPGSGFRSELAGGNAVPVPFDDRSAGCIGELRRAPDARSEVQTVTGRLDAIAFGEHRLTIIYAPKRRALECFYDEQIELMLLENRRDLIQVTGRVIMDDDGHPRRIVEVEQIQELDLSPFTTEDVECGSLVLHPRRRLDIRPSVSEDEQLVRIEYPPWGLDVFASTRAELYGEFREQIAMLWVEYATADDVALSDAAVKVKRCLLSDWEEVAGAKG